MSKLSILLVLELFPLLLFDPNILLRQAHYLGRLTNAIKYSGKAQQLTSYAAAEKTIFWGRGGRIGASNGQKIDLLTASGE